MTPAERIRVFIAGDIYPKRGLVRRFLEDDGYAVVGATNSAKTMTAAIRKSEPDAVVVDGDLLVAGAAGGTLARIREAVPDAKVIVFTAGPPASGSAAGGADGYLEKGVGLSALTALLGNLFVAESSPIAEPAMSGAAAATTGVAATRSASDGRRQGVAAASNGNGPGTMARLVAIASGATLVVWGLIAMIATGGGPAPPPVDRTEGDRGGEVVDLDNALVDARATLRELIGALESGDYVLASLVAEDLLDMRERAREQGFSISDLDADITARLGSVVDLVPARVNTALSLILGSLYPELPDDQGGGGIVEVPNVTTNGTGGGGTADSGGAEPEGGRDEGEGGIGNGGGGNGGGGGGDDQGGGGDDQGGGGGDEDDGDDADGISSGHDDNVNGKGHEKCRGKGHSECDEVAADDHGHGPGDDHGNGPGEDHGSGKDGAPAGQANGHTRLAVITPARQSMRR